MLPSEMQPLVENCTTISDKIRVLHAAGASRSEIAKFLRRRYQHVRNVIVQDEVRAGTRPLPGARAGGSAKLNQPAVLVALTIGSGGEIALGEPILHALNASPGDTIYVSINEDEVRLCSEGALVNELRTGIAESLPHLVPLMNSLLNGKRGE